MKERRYPDEAPRSKVERPEECLHPVGTIVVVIGADQEACYLNRECCEFLGRTTDQVVGRNWFENFLAESARPMAVQVFRRLMGGQVAQESHESQVLTGCGEARMIVWRSRALQDGSGQIVAILSSGESVAEQREADQAYAWNSKVNRVLAELATALAEKEGSFDFIAQVVLDSSTDVTGSSHGLVSSFDDETGATIAQAFGPAESAAEIPEELKVLLPGGGGGPGELLGGHGIGWGKARYSNLLGTSRSRLEKGEELIQPHRFLTVPVKVGDQLLGQILLWNPLNDYTDRDLDAVERIGNLYSLALQRLRARKQLLKNKRWLEELVTERTAELLEVNRSLESEVKERRRAEQTLRDFGSRLINAQEEERSWLARELHDDLNQKLALLAVELQQLGQNPSQSPEAIRNKALELWKDAQRISSDLYNLSHQLHPSQFKLLGLVPALRSLCRDYGEQQGLAIKFSTGTGRKAPVVPEDIALCLYRIAQEALHNVAAHSRAKEANVELSTSRDTVRLCVSDPGIGFDKEDVAAKSGLGLVSMRERIHLARGSLTVESEPSKGTRIVATVPLVHPGSRDGQLPGGRESDEDDPRRRDQ